MIKAGKGALAIFVKTPGFSPIKTRLANSIGKAKAERFHLLSAQAIESVAMRASVNGAVLTPYWAVAEKAAVGVPIWRNFATIWQGDGSLGERLFRVYDEMIQKHPFVIFIGADSPQLSEHTLTEAASQLLGGNLPAYVLGRADDGGFYLFGGTSPVPRASWLSVPYSTATTAESLAEHVKTLGRLTELPRTFDVDTVDEMARLAKFAGIDADPTYAQQALIKWVREFLEVMR